MQGHDGKPSIQCLCRETKNESNLVTCSLQAEREEMKRFLGLHIWQDGEKPLYHLVEQIQILRKMDSLTLAPDNTEEKSLVLLLISMHVSFLWRKKEPECSEICPCSNAAVYCSLHGTWDSFIWIVYGGHKAHLVTDSNTVVERGDKLVRIIVLVPDV